MTTLSEPDNTELSFVENFYRIYLATKLHFTTKSYDYIKNSGKIRNISIIKNRRDVGLVIPIMKIVNDSPKEFLKLCVSNFLYGNDQFLYNGDDTTQHHYIQYRGYLSSKEYHLKRDLSLIDDRAYSAGGLIVYLNRYAMNDLYSGAIRYESFVLLSQTNNAFVDNIRGYFSEKIISRMKKAVTFLPSNDKTKLIIRDSTLSI